MKLVNVLQDPQGVVRVTYSKSDMVHFVAKFFDESGEFFTVKVWIGSDIAKIQSYWKTKSPVAPEKAKVFAALALESISKAKSLFP